MTVQTQQTIALNKEYWSFRNSSTKKFTHGLHKYPARMHPEIAKKIIQDYAQDKKTLVIDPYLGSGGVLIEALLNGNNSIGFDINPLALLISKVKTTVVNSTKIRGQYKKILEKSIKDYKQGYYYPDLIPKDFDIEFWYKQHVIRKLSILKCHIFYSNLEPKILDFLKICFSQTARNSSNQRRSEYKNYRIDSDDLLIFRPNVFDMFSEICEKNCSLMEQFRYEMKGIEAKTIIKYGNATELSSNYNKLKHSFDDSKGQLVMTSPPYGDHKTTVAYGQFSDHIGQWLDLPLKQLREVDKISLGGNKISFEEFDTLDSMTLNSQIKSITKKDFKRALDVYSFYFDLDHSLYELSRILKPGKSHLCFVVANRTVKNEIIKTDKILIELSKKYGFKCIAIHPRYIATKVLPPRNSPNNISNIIGKTMTEENIVILKN